MKHSLISSILIALVVIIFGAIITIFVTNYRVDVIPREPNPLPPISTNECGIESCNGLDIVCSTQPAEVCPAIYKLGDKCRQFAECTKIDGQCQQVENPQFTECKSCVERCEQQYKDNPDSSKVFMCESECGE